jgi:UDP:flavonoid glycosyltransferase YjiC (YdhE family)
LDQWLEPARVAQAVEELTPVLYEFRPNLVVGEMFMAGAALAAEQVDVPFVVAGWPAPLDHPPQNADPFLNRARQRLDQILEQARVSGVNWTQLGPPALCSPHLHISYWSPSWFMGLEPATATRAPYGAQTVHVGGRAPTPKPPDAALPDPQDRPWVLITLGTTFNEDVAFFRMAAQAVVEMGGLPIIATGAPLDTPWVEEVRARAPREAEIRAWVDLAAVLPYCAAAVQHGGAGTTHALITHAVPQIVVPHAADQMRQAYGVARTGIGVSLLPKNTSVAALVQVLSQLLPDRAAPRINAQTLQAEFAARGGPSAAAQRLVQLAEDR